MPVSQGPIPRPKTRASPVWLNRFNLNHSSRSVALRELCRGEDELLLVGGGDFLVEAVQIGIFVWLEKSEIVGEETLDLNGTVLCGADYSKHGVVGPIQIGAVGCALN